MCLDRNRYRWTRSQRPDLSLTENLLVDLESRWSDVDRSTQTADCSDPAGRL